MSELVRRSLVVGLAVGLMTLAMWWPATTCEGESFSCLGWVVVTIFAMPIVAFFVGLVVGALVRLRRPWLLAMLGPIAAFGVVRAVVSIFGPELPSFVLSAALVAVVYVGIALLLRPGTSVILRVAAILVAVAMIVLPGQLT